MRSNQSSPTPSNSLETDERELIRSFLLSRKRSLISSNLRLEYSEEAIRISDRQDNVLGLTTQLNEWEYQILIDPIFHQNDVLERLISELELVKWVQSELIDFEEYRRYQIPHGYKLNYTDIIRLWKFWWQQKHQRNKIYNLQLDILVFFKSNWYPIQELELKQTNFYLKTIVGELLLTPDQQLPWIQKEDLKVNPSLSVESSDIVGKETIANGDKPQDIGSVKQTSNDNIEDLISSEPEEDNKLLVKETPENVIITEKEKNNVDINHLLAELAELSPIPPENTSPEQGDWSSDLKLEVIKSTENAHGETKKDSETDLLRDRQVQELYNLAIAILKEYLEKGKVINNTEIIKNSHGEVISIKNTETVESCPQWVIDRVFQIVNTPPPNPYPLDKGV